MLSLPLLLTLGLAHAQDTIDLGVLKDSDISVVQKLLYPKDGRTEMAIHVGWMPFDAFTTTPIAAVSYGSFLSETFGWEAELGGGYSLKNATYKALEGPLYGVAPDAYRYLVSATGGVTWSPIYAKMNIMGKKVVHYDIYGLANVGATLETAILPDHAIAVAPTIGLGVGGRFFLSKDTALRVQAKDELLIESRKKTEDTHLKHNVGITVGFSLLSKVAE